MNTLFCSVELKLASLAPNYASTSKARKCLTYSEPLQSVSLLMIMCTVVVENEVPNVDDNEPYSIKELCTQVSTVHEGIQRPKADIIVQYLLKCIPPVVVDKLITCAYAFNVSQKVATDSQFPLPLCSHMYNVISLIVFSSPKFHYHFNKCVQCRDMNMHSHILAVEVGEKNSSFGNSTHSVHKVSVHDNHL